MKFNVLKKIGLSHLLVIFLTLSGSIAAFEVEGDNFEANFTISSWTAYEGKSVIT